MTAAPVAPPALGRHRLQPEQNAKPATGSARRRSPAEQERGCVVPGFTIRPASGAKRRNVLRSRPPPARARAPRERTSADRHRGGRPCGDAQLPRRREPFVRRLVKGRQTSITIGRIIGRPWSVEEIARAGCRGSSSSGSRPRRQWRRDRFLQGFGQIWTCGRHDRVIGVVEEATADQVGSRDRLPGGGSTVRRPSRRHPSGARGRAGRRRQSPSMAAMRRTAPLRRDGPGQPRPRPIELDYLPISSTKIRRSEPRHPRPAARAARASVLAVTGMIVVAYQADISFAPRESRGETGSARALVVHQRPFLEEVVDRLGDRLLVAGVRGRDDHGVAPARR